VDRFQAMEVFTRVVETGSFTRAAHGLRIPKTRATTLIQRMEAALGVRLLNRSTRKVGLTPDGAAYYEQCRAILAQVREAEESLAQRHAAPRGRLRVEVPTLMARLVIVPALPGFFARYPKIELELGCSERRGDLIDEGIDCAVWSGEIEDSSLIARGVGQLFFATCAAPAYLAAHGEPVHPRDLAAHRCINRFSQRTGRIADWIFAKDGQRIEVPMRGHIALDDENSYLAAAEAGLGVARIPAFVVKEAMEHSRLELVLGDWFPEPAPLSVVYPQRRHMSGKVRVFVDWIAALFGEHDGIQLRSSLPGR
jgi:LysR family transcriptional regulator for bpeEF and oprC